jgi:hypothetical protein
VKEMLSFLDTSEKEDLQKRGYMFEHLLCFYSVFSEKTALYDKNFPVYFNPNNEADVILFGLGESCSCADKIKCIKDLANFPLKELNIVSPTLITDIKKVQTISIDWDFHINVNNFDFNMRGSKYRSIRNKISNSKKKGYYTKISREFTLKHLYIMSKHMASHQLDLWDYEELLSLEHFLRKHDHGFLMEAYQNETLLGFDFVDFFEENLIMAVPLGVYLDNTLLGDFMMYENLKYAKKRGYKWIDVGPTCGNEGLKKFKEKWFAQPKYKLFIQKIILNHL